MLSNGSSRILIVDDDAALLEALPMALRMRMSDVEVDTCDSATCAMAFIEKTDYDAIISDIKMPGMDGLALLSEVKTRRPETPTLLITGHGEHDLAVEALRGGAYDFIQKPIDRDYFIASLRRAIKTRQLARQVEQHQLAMAELRLAREIQQKLFPAEAPQLEGFDIAGASYPASNVGGDYYDFVSMRDGSLGVIVADVMGHGVGPALLMAETRAFLRALALTSDDAGEILTCVNAALVSDTPVEHFVTLLFVRLDPQNRQISYASAGHTTSFVLDAQGKVRHRLESTETALGLLPDARYAAAPDPITLGSGDIVFLLTDGVVEASPVAGMDPLDDERAINVVRRNRGKPAREIVSAVYDAVQAHLAGQPQSDDITAAVIKVL